MRESIRWTGTPFIALANLFRFVWRSRSERERRKQMRTTYWVNRNAQEKGHHVVHRAGCAFIPLIKNRICLGEHDTWDSAIRDAERHYSRAEECVFCPSDSPH